MNKHTADTLKFCIGQKCIDISTNTVYDLNGIDCFTDEVLVDDDHYSLSFPILGTPYPDHEANAVKFSTHCFYPILRPAEDLTREEICDVYSLKESKNITLLSEKNEEGAECYADGTIFIYWERVYNGAKNYEAGYNNFTCSYREFTPQIMLKLLKIGAGAIPDKTSSTGYVDFIHGLPCYTPKMIEEMGL